MTVNGYDDLAINNMALNLLGQSPINSIEEPTSDNEATCARIYPITVLSLLSRHPWNFANPVRQLAVNGDITPVGNYLYAYKLPSDMLSGPEAVFADGNLKRPVHDYEVADDHVHCNYTRIDVRYAKKTSPATWPAYFVELVVMALASRLAKPIADNTALTTEYRIAAFGPAEMDGEGGLFKTAKGLDAKSQPMKSLFRNGDPLTAQVF